MLQKEHGNDYAEIQFLPRISSRSSGVGNDSSANFATIKDIYSSDRYNCLPKAQTIIFIFSNITSQVGTLNPQETTIQPFKVEVALSFFKRQKDIFHIFVQLRFCDRFYPLMCLRNDNIRFVYITFYHQAGSFYEPEFLSVKIKWPRLMRKCRVFVVM